MVFGTSINGVTDLPKNLCLELERHGFTVLEQSGEVTENAICVHQDVCLPISDTSINKH